jgi:hypothetical protein
MFGMFLFAYPSTGGCRAGRRRVPSAPRGLAGRSGPRGVRNDVFVHRIQGIFKMRDCLVHRTKPVPTAVKDSVALTVVPLLVTVAVRVGLL